jgi:hypothetical protein
MFGVVGGSTAGPKCISVFFKSLCEAPSRLPYIRLVAVRALSLYAPDLLYLSRVWGFGISSFCSVLLARMAIRMSAFLSMFVMKVVSLPKYVKGAHLCVVMLPGSWLGVAAIGCVGVGGLSYIIVYSLGPAESFPAYTCSRCHC